MFSLSSVKHSLLSLELTSTCLPIYLWAWLLDRSLCSFLCSSLFFFYSPPRSSCVISPLPISPSYPSIMAHSSVSKAPDVSLLDLTFNDNGNEAFNELTMVGKLISHKVINYSAINAILTSSWNLGPNIIIKSLNPNLILCTFRNAEDRDSIVNAGPWTVKEVPLNLQPWPPTLTLQEINFSTTPFWIQIHNLPCNRMNAENVRKIGNYVGQFLHSDPESYTYFARKFLRVRMAVNITQICGSRSSMRDSRTSVILVANRTYQISMHWGTQIQPFTSQQGVPIWRLAASKKSDHLEEESSEEKRLTGTQTASKPSKL